MALAVGHVDIVTCRVRVSTVLASNTLRMLPPNAINGELSSSTSSTELEREARLVEVERV